MALQGHSRAPRGRGCGSLSAGAADRSRPIREAPAPPWPSQCRSPVIGCERRWSPGPGWACPAAGAAVRAAL
eukprot:1817024-Heterocapsa_arctica.AAC.1